jgi:hypothetical protein
MLPTPAGWIPTPPTLALSAMGPVPLVDANLIADLGASFDTTPDVGVLSSVHGW